MPCLVNIRDVVTGLRAQRGAIVLRSPYSDSTYLLLPNPEDPTRWREYSGDDYHYSGQGSVEGYAGSIVERGFWSSSEWFASEYEARRRIEELRAVGSPN